MRVIISPRAEKQLKKISKVNQIILARKIGNLKSTKVSTASKLSGYQNIFRVRVGDYRIVYRKTKQEVYIVLIAHRKEVYRIFSRFFI